jgi:hypothetical protein
MHAAATVHACAVKIVTYRDNYKQNRGFLTFDCSQKKGRWATLVLSFQLNRFNTPFTTTPSSLSLRLVFLQSPTRIHRIGIKRCRIRIKKQNIGRYIRCKDIGFHYGSTARGVALTHIQQARLCLCVCVKVLPNKIANLKLKKSLCNTIQQSRWVGVFTAFQPKV